MKYLADLLTVLRFVAAGVTAWLLIQDRWSWAAVSFGLGLLSDAFDGMAARRWPYSDAEAARLPWRKHPHALDNAADLALSSAGLVGLSLSLLPLWQAIGLLTGVAGVSLVFVIHVNIMIDEGRPEAAEKTDVVHGFVYGIELVAMLVIMTVLATPAWPFIVTLYAMCGIPLLWMKRDRLTSRPEVDYRRT